MIWVIKWVKECSYSTILEEPLWGNKEDPHENNHLHPRHQSKKSDENYTGTSSRSSSEWTTLLIWVIKWVKSTADDQTDIERGVYHHPVRSSVFWQRHKTVPQFSIPTTVSKSILDILDIHQVQCLLSIQHPVWYKPVSNRFFFHTLFLKPNSCICFLSFSE